MNHKITNKNESFQGLRAIAYFGVFLSHTGLGLDVLGSWAVSIFFCLSGFLMLINYHDRNIVLNNCSFAWMKIKKLYPLHISMMIPAIIYAIISGSSFRKIIADVILHTTLVQIWIPIPRYYCTLNSVAWYLSVSAFLYFMFPWILIILKKANKRRVQILALSTLCSLFLIAFLAKMCGNEDINAIFSMYWITYFCPVSRLLDFTLGCCLGKLFYLKRETINKIHGKKLFRDILILVLLSFTLFVYDKKGTVFAEEYIRYTLIFIPTTLMIIWNVACGGGIAQFLNNRILVKFGDISPYTYLIHYVVIEYCCAIANQITTQYSRLLIAIISFVLTFVSTQIWIRLTDSLSNKNSNRIFFN